MSLKRFKCCVCGAVEMATGGSHLFRCQPCVLAGRFKSARHQFGRVGKERAGMIVARLIRAGDLPRPDTLRCVDCAGPAREYEHRDYNRPTAVEPICRACNLRRGPAIPLRGSVEALLQRGCIPYRSRRRVAQLCTLLGKPHVANGLPAKVSLADWHRIWPELISKLDVHVGEVLTS